MAKSSKYYCNLCNREIYNTDRIERFEGVGLDKSPAFMGGWVMEEGSKECKMQATAHLCYPCLSSIQKMTKYCGEGFKCNGGPNCGSDHK